MKLSTFLKILIVVNIIFLTLISMLIAFPYILNLLDTLLLNLSREIVRSLSKVGIPITLEIALLPVILWVLALLTLFIIYIVISAAYKRYSDNPAYLVVSVGTMYSSMFSRKVAVNILNEIEIGLPVYRYHFEPSDSISKPEEVVVV